MPKQAAKKVSNKKVEVPTSKKMNDKDYLQDVLENLKNLSNNLSIALNEASCEPLYKELFLIYKETQSAQRLVFQEVFKRGWYSLEEADEKKTKQKHQELTKQLKECA